MTYTNEQIQFIKDNYRTMIEPDMAEKLKISRFHVQKIKRQHKLTVYPRNARKEEAKVIKLDLFDYDKCWII